MGLRQLVGALVFAGALVACGKAPVGEPPVASLEEEESVPSAVALDGRGTFFGVRSEGEVTYVRRLNAKQTRCAEGDEKPECRVAVFHVPDGAARTPESVYRGTLAFEADQSVFTATEVWSPDVSIGETPSGTFFRVEGLSILCARAPCPPLKQAKLNSAASAKFLQILTIDDDLGTEEARKAAVDEALSSALLVVGKNTPKKEGLLLEAVQYYRRVDAPATPALTDP